MHASARLHEESRVPGDIRFGCKRTKGARDERPFFIKDSKLEGVDVALEEELYWERNDGDGEKRAVGALDKGGGVIRKIKSETLRRSVLRMMPAVRQGTDFEGAS
jgi:hypothetical protein